MPIAQPCYTPCYIPLFVCQVHLIPVARGPGSVSPLPAGTPDPWDAARVVAAYPELSLASHRINQVGITLSGAPPLVISTLGDRHFLSCLFSPLQYARV